MELKQFEKILGETIKQFKDIKKIGFIGAMGSLNMERDLDLILTPAQNVKKGEFLKVMCNFLELLGNNTKKQKSRVIMFPYSVLQEEVKYLAKVKKGKDVFLHIQTFVDLVPPHPKTFNALLTAQKHYWGKRESMKLIPKTSMDFEYFVLFMINCLYSHYPKKLESDKICSEISYILKHNNGKIDFKGKSNKEIYFEGCDFIDSLAKVI